MNQSNQPLVSVVIACYNHERFVQDSIQSVIDQTYQNIELIIIDDGSKDGSVKKIQEMIPTCKERFFRFEFRYRPNKGLSTTLNEALEWCEGIYFSALASDDIIKPHKISYQTKILNSKSHVSGVFGSVDVILKNGEILKNKLKQREYNFVDIFLHEHNLPALTQLIRLQDLRDVNGFREKFIIEDWVMWLDLTQSGKSLYLDEEVMGSYRRHEGNLSGQLNKMFEGRLQIIESFQEHSLYKKAKAKVYFIQAIEQQSFDKKKSMPLMIKAISLNLSLVFTKSFMGYLAKFVIKRNSFFI